MKKTYLIIAGMVAIVILLALWAYLLIYGTPKPVTNFFTDFSFAGNTDGANDPLPPPIPDSQVDVSTEQLRQLTLKPVSGFAEVTKGDNEERFIYYVEAGTGHIYSINLISGAETRISNITIPNTTNAAISNDGNFVAISSGYSNAAQKFTILNISDPANISSTDFEKRISDFTWNVSGQLLYTTYLTNGLVGQSYNPTEMTTRDLFTVPFISATVVWDTTINNKHYVYPKASTKLNGYLYAITNGKIKRLPLEGYGLTALASKDFVVVTTQTGTGAPLSEAVNLTDDTISKLTGISDPNKCAFSEVDTSILYCGYTRSSYGAEFPDDWYKGTRSFSDQIWEVNIKRGTASQLVNPEAKLGRAIDVTNMQFNNGSGVLYFINKNDNTLWMYEI